MALKATDYLFTPSDIIRLWNYLLDLSVKQWLSLFLIGVAVYIGQRYQVGLTNLVFLALLLWVFFFNVDARVPLKGALISLVGIIFVVLVGKYSPYYIDADAWSESIAVWVYFFLAIGVLKQVKDHFIEGGQSQVEEEARVEAPVAYVLGPEKKPKRPGQKMVVDLSARNRRTVPTQARVQYKQSYEQTDPELRNEDEIVVPRKPVSPSRVESHTVRAQLRDTDESGAADDILQELRKQELIRQQNQPSYRTNLFPAIESNEPQDYSDQQELLFAPYVRSELIVDPDEDLDQRGAFDFSEPPVYEEPPIPRTLSNEEEIELRQYAYQQAAFTDDELFEEDVRENRLRAESRVEKSVSVPVDKRPARSHPVARQKATKKYEIVKVGNRMTVRDLEKERKQKIKAEYEKKKAQKQK